MSAGFRPSQHSQLLSLQVATNEYNSRLQFIIQKDIQCPDTLSITDIMKQRKYMADWPAKSSFKKCVYNIEKIQTKAKAQAVNKNLGSCK